MLAGLANRVFKLGELAGVGVEFIHVCLHWLFVSSDLTLGADRQTCVADSVNEAQKGI